MLNHTVKRGLTCDCQHINAPVFENGGFTREFGQVRCHQIWQWQPLPGGLTLVNYPAVFSCCRTGSREGSARGAQGVLLPSITQKPGTNCDGSR